MKNVLVLRPDAEEDVEAAFTWYEQQRHGLGAEFLLAVEAGLEAIQREPGAHAAVHKRARRHLLRRFPYALYFVVGSESIEVVACTHVRRHPGRWRKRV